MPYVTAGWRYRHPLFYCLVMPFGVVLVGLITASHTEILDFSMSGLTTAALVGSWVLAMCAVGWLEHRSEQRLLARSSAESSPGDDGPES